MLYSLKLNCKKNNNVLFKRKNSYVSPKILENQTSRNAIKGKTVMSDQKFLKIKQPCLTK